MQKKPVIFICDDEPEILRYLAKLLQSAGYDVQTFVKGVELLQLLQSADLSPCDLLLQDMRLPDIGGEEILSVVLDRFPEMPVVIMTAHGTIDDAVNAMKTGAYDYLAKPFPKEKLLGTIGRLFEHRRLARENQELKERLQQGESGDAIVFRSDSFRKVYELALDVAESDANVLVTGESGTGKELIAGSLHRNSQRNKKPFISINCAVLTDNLLESQLFGHVRGAFTGAVTNQMGLIEAADNGTLFLDEIGDISSVVQAKLLRVIQEKNFIPLGTTKSRSVDVRFVAATNKDLLQEVKASRFREDLYYRLNVITITLPPLRDRREDIEPLARYFMQRISRRMKKYVRDIDPLALKHLVTSDWHGNVRELENVMERAVILARNGVITRDLLPVSGLVKNFDDMKQHPLLPLEVVERNHIASVLRETNYHKSRSAEILGISRKTLDRKIVEYSLSEELFK